tara:strand:+ start:103 stop:654 length:552 start_codon:yes stop_codon:yes gene_type:complete
MLNYKTTLFIFIFILGFYIVLTRPSKIFREPLTNKKDCPDLLVQIGSKIYLFNSKRAEIPGVNPIEFRNLEEYVEFIEWQKSQDINCPVLFLQKTYDPQGNSMYRIKPSPTDNFGGIPPVLANEKISKIIDATRDDPPYNTNSYPGFDPMNQRIGILTELDKIHEKGLQNSNNKNAMDYNWKH